MRFPRLSHAYGFSLIEIMIGMSIGAMALMAILQLFGMSESYKGLIGGGSDAQNNGVIALHVLQREIANAGYGLTPVALLGCDLTLPADGTNPERSIKSLSPVLINDNNIPAGDSNTDTLRVLYANTAAPTEGDEILTPWEDYTTVTLNPPVHYLAGDKVIASPAQRTDCSNLVMSSVIDAPDTSLTTNTALFQPAPSPTGSYTLINLGPNPQFKAYAIRKGNLTVCDYLQHDCNNPEQVDDPLVWQSLVSHIASLRIQYGHDYNSPNGVDSYDQAIRTPTTDPSSTIECGWRRTPALRLAVVAREITRTSEAIMPNASPLSWAGEDGAPIDLSQIPEWEHYRYRKFETSIDLPNIVWLQSSGC